MTWFSIIQVIFGDYSILVIAVLTYLLALGVYKLIKDWLPF